MSDRNIPGVLAPPPLIFLAFLLGGWGLSVLLSDPGLGLPSDVSRYLAFALIAGGVVIDGAAIDRFRRVGTPAQPWQASTALAVDGLYRFSRNPMYLGFALIYAGLVVVIDSLIAAALLIPCLVVIDLFVIRREERYMAARFGADYDAYRRKVRRWL